MKYFLAIFAVIVVVQALEGEQKAKFEAAYKGCVEKTGVDEGLIKKMRQKQFVDDPKLKAYVNCMFELFGFAKDGHINVDVIKSKLPASADKSAADKIVEKCKGKQGVVPNEVAYNVYTCFVEDGSIKLF